MSKLKGWRTILFNTLAAFMPLLDEYALGGYIPDDYMLLYLCFVVAGNLILRVYTSTPVGRAD